MFWFLDVLDDVECPNIPSQFGCWHVFLVFFRVCGKAWLFQRAVVNHQGEKQLESLLKRCRLDPEILKEQTKNGKLSGLGFCVKDDGMFFSGIH